MSLYEEIHKRYGGNRIIMARFTLSLSTSQILLYTPHILHSTLNIFIKEQTRIII